MLYEVPQDKQIDPSDLEDNVRITRAANELHKKTFDKMIRTIDVAISKLKPTKTSALIWTKAGAMLGYKSPEPVKDINHLWESASSLYDGKNLKKFVGTLVMWRIALNDNTWLMTRQDSGKFDPDTGKEIKNNVYWIDNNYKSKAPTIDDLIKKFKGKK